MKEIFLFIALFCNFVVFSATFYTTSKIPNFNPHEKVVLDEFGVNFQPFTFTTSIKKHNKSVGLLIENYGEKWKDSLALNFKESKRDINFFLKCLFSGGGISTEKKTKSIYYKNNGLISSIAITVYLKREGGGMVHRRQTIETYNASGKLIDRESREVLGSGCCFTANTKVCMDDNSLKSISEIRKGDQIKTYNILTNQFSDTEVLETLNIKHRNLYKLDFGSFSITTTADHPFLLERRWGAINPELAKKHLNGANCTKIEVNLSFSAFINGELSYQSLKSIELLSAEQMTYTITRLSKGHTFIANGLIVGVESIQ